MNIPFVVNFIGSMFAIVWRWIDIKHFDAIFDIVIDTMKRQVKIIAAATFGTGCFTWFRCNNAIFHTGKTCKARVIR